MSAANALHSLYAGKAKRLGDAPARAQEIHTPPWIVEAVRQAFGGMIYLDPCAATSDGGQWFAKWNDTLPEHAQALVRRLGRARTPEARAALKRKLKPHYLRLPDELEDRTFINPPFDFLEPWMKLAASEGAWALEGGGEPKRIVMLVPVRPHRRWWTRYAAGAQGVWLAAFPFVGQTAHYPAPVCLLARNCTIPPLGKRETGRFVL